MPMKGPDDPRYVHEIRWGCNYWAPTSARCEELRELVKEHMKPVHDDIGWKGPCEAVVSKDLVADVREAMDFVGSIVDLEEELEDGNVRLFSKGYWAHGFDCT